MDADLQLLALVLGCAGVLISVRRRAVDRAVLSTTQRYLFVCGSAILSVVLIAAAVIILAGCSPFAGLRSPTSTAAVTARPTVTAAPGPTARPIQLPTPSPTCQVRTGIPAGFLNMRRGAGVQFAVIRVLDEGEILKVIQRAAWLKVIDEEGQQGFVNARYCEVVP
jgi:uncharacterized protein YgiM (DUF1202 family)